MFLLVYVDDVTLIGFSSQALQHFIHSLHEFSLKDLGFLHYFLGIAIHHLADSFLFFNQQKCVDDLLKKDRMLHSQPSHSLICSITCFSTYYGDDFPHVSSYRSFIGSLQYITLTRSDLSHSVNKVCQFMSSPKDVHWEAVKNILCY